MTENENIQIAIGNLTAIKLICKKFENAEETIDLAIKALEKVQQFEAIGTVEEFKALKEKNEPKMMDGYYCPICRHYFEDGELFLFCPCCGQKLDWQ